MRPVHRRALPLVAKIERIFARHPALRAKPQSRLPALPAEARLAIGRDSERKPFMLDASTRREHIDCVGATGSGKSVLLRHALWTDIEHGRAVVHLDPHGGHPDSNHRATVAWLHDTGLYRSRVVHVIDLNSPYCVGFNPLSADARPSVVAGNMVEAFERVRGDEDTMQRPTLRRSLLGILATLAELNWTLADAELLLDPADRHGIRAWALALVKDRYARRLLERLDALGRDPRLRREFEVEVIGATNRLADLLSTPEVRACLGQTGRLLDMRQALDEGHVVLANLSGGSNVYETSGDLLGRLLIRAVLFAAKRRTNETLATVYADECARYLSDDWDRALAELRKYSVSMFSVHQNYAQLGEPADKVRQAIEQLPRTKISFRLNSLREAAEIAPELLDLDLEMPVLLLRKPAVVGHERVVLFNGSAGFGVSSTLQTGNSVARSTAHTDADSWSESVTESESHSESSSRSSSSGEHESTAQTNRDGETIAETDSRGTSSQDTESSSTSDAYSRSWSSSTSGSSARTEGRSKTDSNSVAHGFSLNGAVGAAQALRPVLKDLDTAVHSLENVKLKAGQMLCALPTGSAIVRTAVNGKVSTALVRVPFRRARKLSEREYAETLTRIVADTPSTLRMADALSAVEARDQALKRQAMPLDTAGSHRRRISKKANGAASARYD